MSYGSIDAGSFGSRNPFGGPTRQGYQPVATQVSPSELQDVFQETSSNIFQINANLVTLEKNLQSLGTSRDTAELRQSLHSTQQQTNKVITSTSQLVKQLTDIISGSSRQDRLRLTRLNTELSDSVQRYGDLQKKIADRSRALLPPAQKDGKQSLQTPLSELVEEGPFFGVGESVEGDAQAFLSEISEEDVEILRQREEALLQIERDMLDVSQIMKDLASMVHEQGDTIEAAEEEEMLSANRWSAASYFAYHRYCSLSQKMRARPQRSPFQLCCDLSSTSQQNKSLYVEVHLRSLPFFLSLSILLSDCVCFCVCMYGNVGVRECSLKE
uniref:t-SNARE Domain Containing 1 n=1 Tax=Cyprinus carpio carpio TaxID=630221 RepID=A0A8C1CIX4_CYPCA